MFKIKNQTSIAPEKIELKSLPFSRVYILNNVLVIIYDDFISINNNKIYFKVSNAIKIDVNQLYITDDHKCFLLDFDKFSIKEINKNFKTIKENEICINDQKIRYGSNEIENEIKYGDLDYNGNEDTYYYTCNVDEYILVCTNKSCTIYLFDNELEEIFNDVIYVHCRKDNTPLYLRGIDSNENFIVTLDEEGTVNKYIINEDSSVSVFNFIDYEGNETYKIFKEIIKAKDNDIGIKNTNEYDIRTSEEDFLNNMNIENENSSEGLKNNTKDSSESIKNDTFDTFKDIKNDSKDNLEGLKNDTLDVDNTLEDLISNITVQKNKEDDNKNNTLVINKNDEYLITNFNNQDNILNENTIETNNKTSENKLEIEDTVSTSTLENVSVNQFKNNVKETINNIIKESKNTVEKSVKQIDEKNTFKSMSKDFSSFMNTSDLHIEKNNVSNSQQNSNIINYSHINHNNLSNNQQNSNNKSINDALNSSQVKLDNNNSFNNFVENSKVIKPTTAETLSNSTEKIILDIKNIKVNKFHFSNYEINKFIVDSDMTKLYNNILKLENVDCIKKDIEDKLLFMINNLKIRQGLDSNYVKESVKFFDKKINEKNIIKMPFEYNTGIISDNCINLIEENQDKTQNSICKIDLIKVYETGNLIIIKNENTNNIKEMKQKSINLKNDQNKKDSIVLNLDQKKQDKEFMISEQINQEPINVKTEEKREEIVNGKHNEQNIGPQSGVSNNVPTFSFSSNATQTFPTNSSDIFNKFININNNGSSIPVLPKEEKKDNGKVPNAFSRFANSNNLYK